MKSMKTWVSACAVMAAVVVPRAQGAAQDIEQAVRLAPDGTIRLTFSARDGVCGDGNNVVTGRRRSEDSEWACDPGPVRVALTKRDGEIARIRTHVGGRWRTRSNVTDLGRVSARRAADFLVGIVEGGDDDRIGREAILPATLADSAEVWPALLRVAQDEDRSRTLRKAVLQHVGMAASRAVIEQADPDVPRVSDYEARERAVFAVSQLPDRQGIPILLEVAQVHRDPEIRGRALFWLGQSGDERAIELFQEILTGTR